MTDPKPAARTAEELLEVLAETMRRSSEGSITPTEAKRITADATAEIARMEAALRAAKTIAKVSPK